MNPLHYFGLYGAYNQFQVSENAADSLGEHNRSGALGSSFYQPQLQVGSTPVRVLGRVGVFATGFQGYSNDLAGRDSDEAKMLFESPESVAIDLNANRLGFRFMAGVGAQFGRVLPYVGIGPDLGLGSLGTEGDTDFRPAETGVFFNLGVLPGLQVHVSDSVALYAEGTLPVPTGVSSSWSAGAGIMIRPRKAPGDWMEPLNQVLAEAGIPPARNLIEAKAKMKDKFRAMEADLMVLKADKQRLEADNNDLSNQLAAAASGGGAGAVDLRALANANGIAGVDAMTDAEVTAALHSKLQDQGLEIARLAGEIGQLTTDKADLEARLARRPQGDRKSGGGSGVVVDF